MNLFFVFLLVYAMVYIFWTLSLSLVLSYSSKDHRSELLTTLPFISILVSAKNEEQDILRCLKSLSLLDYPSHLHEVLIADDGSTDATAAVVEKFMETHPNFKLISITSKLGKADAKANALAHLARQAHGAYFLITDADIKVQPLWAKTLVSYHQPKIGIVSSSTAIEGKALFAKLQNIEWVYTFGLIYVCKCLRIPVTAVGNNMLISREAYESTGGYEHFDFSITEDYELFKQTLTRGWGYDNIIHPMGIAYSLPIKTFKELLQQRKRWMHGAVQVPGSLGFFLGMQVFYLPILIFSLITVPFVALLFVNLKMGFQYFFISRVFKKAGLPMPSISLYVLFEVYSSCMAILTVVVYLLPSKVKWKGRSF